MKGWIQLKFRIVDKGYFKVIGFMETVQINGSGTFIPNYNESNREQIQETLEQLLNERISNIFNIVINKSDQLVDSYIGIETEAMCPPSLVEVAIPKQTWAVFEIVSLAPYVINKTWHDLFAFWFPVHGYELADNVEFYLEKREHNRFELWIPVKKRPFS